MRERWLISLDLASVTRTRHEFRKWLERCVGNDHPLTEYELVFGELVTNAVRYGRAPINVEAECSERRLSIRVEDWGSCFEIAKARPARPLAEGGRGLDIVKALASDVTVNDGADHPCVVVATMDLVA
jgi:anti-sigma regulatory factor (Ser/Thr protein kinase)